MTQEDKELLMRDLSCRIPYGVIVNVYRMPNVKLTSVSWYDEVSVEDSIGLHDGTWSAERIYDTYVEYILSV